MPRVLTMALKDLKLISRDPIGLFFMIGFPIGMGVMFGIITGSFSTESARIEIAVVDEDDSDTSQRFVDELGATGNVVIHRLDREQAANRVRKGELAGMIVVPEGFGDQAAAFWNPDRPAIGLGVDPTRRAEAGMLQGLVMQASGALMGDFFQNPDVMRPLILDARDQMALSDDIPESQRQVLEGMMGSLDEVMGWMDDLSDAGTEADGAVPQMELARIEEIDVTVGSASTDGPQLQSRWDISFPQAMLWGVLGCAAGFAVSLVREQTRGTMLRLQVAPVSRNDIMAGKATACFLAVMCVIAIMVLLGYAIGMRPNSIPLLLLAAGCVAVCFVGVMMLMSVIGRSEEAVGGAGWGANIVMAMFGGGMVPLAFMPPFMTTISNFSPVKWGILAIEGAVWRDFSFAEMILPCTVLLLIGVGGMAAGSAILRRRW